MLIRNWICRSAKRPNKKKTYTYNIYVYIVKIKYVAIKSIC